MDNLYFGFKGIETSIRGLNEAVYLGDEVVHLSDEAVHLGDELSELFGQFDQFTRQQPSVQGLNPIGVFVQYAKQVFHGMDRGHSFSLGLLIFVRIRNSRT